MAFPTHTLSNVAAMPGDVKDALPALTMMMVNGAVNFLIAVLILIAGWMVARGMGSWIQAKNRAC
jgi:type IV secretory pathway VirB2 component (pilin)